jgi:hypothetical protein
MPIVPGVFRIKKSEIPGAERCRGFLLCFNWLNRRIKKLLFLFG